MDEFICQEMLQRVNETHCLTHISHGPPAEKMWLIALPQSGNPTATGADPESSWDQHLEASRILPGNRLLPDRIGAHVILVCPGGGVFPVG